MLHSQTNDTLYYSGNYKVIIDSIKVEGNKITKSDVITRELTFGIGDTVTPKIISYNRERIFSLGLFTNVKLSVAQIKNINILLIDVSESWYIYPIPFVELQDRDWKKISYGLDVFIKNFRGENETVRAQASFGYDPRFLIFYDHPYILRNQNIYLSAEFYYQNAKNRSSIAQQLYGGDFDQKFISGSIDIGKRFNLFNKLDVNFGYDYVETPFFIKGVSASNQRIDRQLSLGVSYLFDTRDLAQFPSTGTYFSSMFQLKGLGLNDINYQIVNLDYREYFDIFSKLIFKWRFASRLTFGKLVPYYNYSYLGYSERLRGHFNEEREGNDSYLGSIEFNYPVIKDINVNLHFIPVIPKSLLSYRFAFYMELFMDTGTTMLNGQHFSMNDLSTGYGTGLIFLVLPYNSLRIEYALNEYGHSEWILGIGVSF